MIKFSNLSQQKILEFAGKVIFNRGLQYYEDEHVLDFEYNPDKHVLHASVQGSRGDYFVNVWNHNDMLEAECDCPFEGYPCKHIVAVLLYYLDNREKYIKELTVQQNINKSVKEKLSSLSKDEIIEILSSLYNKYPKIKHELMLQLSVDQETVIKQFAKEIKKIFRAFDKQSFSTLEISHKLQEILKQIETADYKAQIEITWKITDGIIGQLSEYGMDDEVLENLAIISMESLVDLFNEHPDYNDMHKKILVKLHAFVEQDNCCIVDDIYDTIWELEHLD